MVSKKKYALKNGRKRRKSGAERHCAGLTTHEEKHDDLGK